MNCPNMFPTPIQLEATELYIRPCYKDIMVMLADAIRDRKSAKICITGTPGIGKSAFLPYLLFSFLSEPGKLTHIIFQRPSSYTLFTLSGDKPPVEIEEFSDYFNETSLYIIDGAGPMRTDAYDSAINPILWISSPRASNDFTHFMDKAAYFRWCMPTWSVDELRAVVPQEGDQLSGALKRFSMYGGIPRRFLDDASTTMRGFPIHSALNDSESVVGILKANGSPSKNFPNSHVLFHMVVRPQLKQHAEAASAVEAPNDTDEEVYGEEVPNYSFGDHYVSVASSYVFERIMSKYETDVLQTLADAINETDDRSYVGRMYEQYVIHQFKLGHIKDAKVRSLSSSSSSSSSSEPPIPYTFECSIIKNLSGIDDIPTAEAAVGQLMVPLSRYQPVFDFICSDKERFDLMQVTIAATHPIRGVNILKKVLEKTSNTPRFIFILPEKYYDSFTEQAIVTSKSTAAVTAPAIEQFALCVPLPVPGPAAAMSNF
jgi:hypothetical protein